MPPIAKLLVSLTVVVVALFACRRNPEIQACADRGVAYFKDIGSYPTLKTDPKRRAEDVALERCRRTTTAF